MVWARRVATGAFRGSAAKRYGPAAREGAAGPPPPASACDEVAVAYERDRLEPGMHPEGLEDAANVVAHRLRAELELLRDLLRRTATLEQAEDLRLAWCEMRWKRVSGLFLDIRHLPEDSDHVAAARQRHRAQLDLDALSLRRQEDATVIRALGRSLQVAREDLARTAGLLRCHD